MSTQSDAIVIGGEVSGLVAAAYLARAGKRVTLLEAQDRLGGLHAITAFGERFSVSPGSQAVHALDPHVVKDLKLARYGLKFVVRDMPLVGLRIDGKHIVLQRDVHAAAASIAAYSSNDALAWARFRRELFDLARAMRPLWFGDENVPPKDDARINRLSRISAVAWLDAWFESDALKAALCFDASSGGFSPIETGSALTLIWRAAQEMSGLQGAVAQVSNGTLIESLLASARAAGVEIQTGAEVKALISDGETVTGTRLKNGETLTAPLVLSSLSRRRVLSQMFPPLTAGVAQTAKYARDFSSTGEARILLALRDKPVFSGAATPDGSRFILSENTGVAIAADMAARAGVLADELPMEIVVLSMSDGSLAPEGQHVVSVLVRPVPQNPKEDWQSLKPRLVEHAVQALERMAPGVAAMIVAAKVFTPDDLSEPSSRQGACHILAGYETRIKSSQRGLLFCGMDVEPVFEISGRAARIAARLAVRK